LQLRLATLGLPSLARAESHVLATVDSILDILYRLGGCPRAPMPEEPAVISLATGERLLADHSEALLGPATAGRGVRILVTMPSEVADDGALIRDLIQGGMDCMRINCARDNGDVWARMIEHLRRAEHELGRSCGLVMDLAGPKLRTGPLEPAPRW
jgi:pyruvate kinase